jgi:hypothetical protein
MLGSAPDYTAWSARSLEALRWLEHVGVRFDISALDTVCDVIANALIRMNRTEVGGVRPPPSPFVLTREGASSHLVDGRGAGWGLQKGAR